MCGNEPGREFAAAEYDKAPAPHLIERSSRLGAGLVLASRDMAARDMAAHMGTGTLVSASRHKMPDPMCFGLRDTRCQTPRAPGFATQDACPHVLRASRHKMPVPTCSGNGTGLKLSAAAEVG